FIATVLLLEGLYLTWSAYKGPEAKRIEQRLRAMSAGVSSTTEALILTQRLLSEAPSLQRWLRRLPRVHELDRVLQQSGTNWTVAKLAGISVAFALAVFVAASFVPYLAWTFNILIAAGPATLPFLYILRKRQNRIRKLEQQL